LAPFDAKPPRPPRTGREDLRRPRNLLVTGIVVLALAALLVVNSNLSTERALTAEELYAAADKGEIEEITFITNEDRADVKFKAGTALAAKATDGKRRVNFRKDGLDAERLDKHAHELRTRPAEQGGPVEISIKKEPASTFFQTVVMYLFPWILLFTILWFFVFRQMRAPGVGGSVLSFGKSRAALQTKDKTGVTFKDVAGIDEAKEEVREIIEFLKNPDKFKRLGGRIPRGILLVGSPGCGKTLLAKAIAGEAEVPFFSICGSDFVEMFVGVGASRVRDLFRQAKEKSPCIVFLDEIDAVGRKRGSGLGGGHDEREQTLNAILVEMDGFDTDEGVIVIAATNRPDVLDPALLRPGRFDREIVIDLPDVKGREEILKVHARDVKLGGDVDLKVLARGTPTFSGAELEAVINEAAIVAAMKNREAVTLPDLEEARDKVKWGRKKTSRVMDEEDRKITAFHEAGHALVAQLLEEVEPLHKVTIVPRGPALGATMQLPERDHYHLQKKRLLGNLVVLYAGRIAEEMFCGDISAGAQNDIERATEIARRMVCEWGMSEAIGPVNYSQEEETLSLGREVTRTRNHSDATSVLIDREVKATLEQCYKRSEKILSKNRDKLEAIARALLKYETLSGKDVDDILNGKEPEAREAPAARAEVFPKVTPIRAPEIVLPLPPEVAPEPLGA